MSAERETVLERLRDTFRVRFSSDPSVRAVTPVINGNQEALQELQDRVLELEARVALLQPADPSR